MLGVRETAFVGVLCGFCGIGVLDGRFGVGFEGWGPCWAGCGDRGVAVRSFASGGIYLANHFHFQGF